MSKVCYLLFVVFAAAIHVPTSTLAADDKGANGLRAILVEPRRTAPEQSGGVTWVVAIGVEDYQNVPALKYTGADAVAFAKAFLEVGKLPAKHVFVITDGLPSSRQIATDSSSLRTVITRLTGYARPGDTFIFFFSGHGYAAPDGTMYLATKDFDPKQPADTGISVEFLRMALVNCSAKSQLVFLDACHSGAFHSDRTIDGRVLSTELAAKKGVATIASSSGNQFSGESPKFRQGIFTHWLVQGLRGRANYQIDARIDIQEAFRFVEMHVPQSAQSLMQLKQTPTYAAKNLTTIPTVLKLIRPDRPSDLVAAKNDVPGGEFDPTLIQAMANFASANPVIVIARLKWVLANKMPESAAYQAADEALHAINEKILAGKMKLNLPK